MHPTRCGRRSAISQLTAAASPCCPPSSSTRTARPPTSRSGKSLLGLDWQRDHHLRSLHLCVCPPRNRFVRRPACAPCIVVRQCARRAHIGHNTSARPALPLIGEGCTRAIGGERQDRKIWSRIHLQLELGTHSPASHRWGRLG